MPDSYFAFLSNQRKLAEPDKINGAMRDLGRGMEADHSRSGSKVRSRAGIVPVIPILSQPPRRGPMVSPDGTTALAKGSRSRATRAATRAAGIRSPGSAPRLEVVRYRISNGRIIRYASPPLGNLGEVRRAMNGGENGDWSSVPLIGGVGAINARMYVPKVGWTTQMKDVQAAITENDNNLKVPQLGNAPLPSAPLPENPSPPATIRTPSGSLPFVPDPATNPDSPS